MKSKKSKKSYVDENGEVRELDAQWFAEATLYVGAIKNPVSLTLRGRDYLIDASLAALLELVVKRHGIDLAKVLPPGSVSALPFAEKVIAETPGGRPAIYLKTLRWQRQMTQRTLAKAAGIQASHISAMERGRRPVSKAEAKKLAKVLRGDWTILAKPKHL